ncbi:MAG: DUF4349 domain-containing protein [Nanoarchaeota archaeon]
MGIKDQLLKIKENWLIVLIFAIIIVVLLFNGCSLGTLSPKNIVGDRSYSNAGMYQGESAQGSYYPSSSNSDFAPEVQERKITKTARLSTQVEQGDFQNAEDELKSIVTSTESFLLNQNVYSSGTGKKQYKTGTYDLKVRTDKYEAVASQLKQIGKVTSFTESSQDITGSYTNTQIDLDAEKARLARYR